MNYSDRLEITLREVIEERNKLLAEVDRLTKQAAAGKALAVEVDRILCISWRKFRQMHEYDDMRLEEYKEIEYGNAAAAYQLAIIESNSDLLVDSDDKP